MKEKDRKAVISEAGSFVIFCDEQGLEWRAWPKGRSSMGEWAAWTPTYGKGYGLTIWEAVLCAKERRVENAVLKKEKREMSLERRSREEK